MNILELTPNELTRAGCEALLRELGPAGMLKFLQQFEKGRGDYTLERHQWLVADAKTTFEQIQEMEKQRASIQPAPKAGSTKVESLNPKL